METIAANELDQYVQNQGILIIDLRPRQDYARGHIRGAVNVPHGEFRRELEGKKEMTIVLYCERGALSMSVARRLDEKGYRTRSVVGGIRAYRGKNMVRGHIT